MNVLRYEGNLQPLIKWAVNRGEGTEKEGPPEPFKSWVRKFMPVVCRSDIGYWVGVVTSDSEVDGEWVKRYPHTHIKSMGWSPLTTTIITYLVVPESGGEFGLGGRKESDPYEFIQPEPGLAVKCDARTWHGVRPVHKGNRIALIATGFASVCNN